MRSAVSTLEVVRPRSLEEALDALADPGRGDRPVPLAGGTDLFVYLNAGTFESRRFLDLGRLRELGGIRERDGHLSFGALATFRQIREHPAVRKRLPSLAAAAAEVGGWQIQNRATLAGNVANASPAGDSLPVLLAHDAVIEVRSTQGAREIPFESLYEGYRKLAMRPDELITTIHVPFAPVRSRPFFRKVGTRRAQSISKVVVAGVLARGRDGLVSHARLALGSVAPVTLRARGAEEALLGAVPSAAAAAAALAALERDIAPIDDIRSTREYRLQVSRNVLAQFLRAADPKFLS